MRDKWDRATRWLDELPPRAALASGGVLFGWLGLLTIFLPLWGFGIALMGLVALLLWLAFSGQPVVHLDFQVIDPFPSGDHAIAAEPVRTARLGELLTMVELPGGTFLMGSLESEADRDKDEGPKHRVRLAAFAISATPVTQRLYREILEESPSRFTGDDELPVEQVSFVDAARFCNKLSERTGFALCYQIEGNEVTWDQRAQGYRLPTEAEWEYACRAGSETAYCFGDDPEQLDEYAWYCGNSENRTHAVGRKRPNGWGLFDLHGNVWEWCWDWYQIYKVTNDTSDSPIGPATDSRRVLRGGSFLREPQDLRSASRDASGPTFRISFIGFRCVRGSRRQP